MIRLATRTLALVGAAAAAREIRSLWRWVELWDAEIDLAIVDADIARHFLNDGLLYADDGTPAGRLLRRRRLGAVAALEERGGRDPHPSFHVQPESPTSPTA